MFQRKIKAQFIPKWCCGVGWKVVRAKRFWFWHTILSFSSSEALSYEYHNLVIYTFRILNFTFSRCEPSELPIFQYPSTVVGSFYIYVIRKLNSAYAIYSSFEVYTRNLLCLYSWKRTKSHNRNNSGHSIWKVICNYYQNKL